jgi:hypothetical protein
MIPVVSGAVLEEILRWAYALDVTSERTVLALVLEMLLVAVGLAAWALGRPGSRRRFRSPRTAPRVLRPFAFGSTSDGRHAPADAPAPRP